MKHNFGATFFWFIAGFELTRNMNQSTMLCFDDETILIYLHFRIALSFTELDEKIHNLIKVLLEFICCNSNLE